MLVQIPVLGFVPTIILGSFLNISVSPCPQLYNGVVTATKQSYCERKNELRVIKQSAQCLAESGN